MWNLKNTTYVNNTKKRSRLSCREQTRGYQWGEGNGAIQECMHAQTLSFDSLRPHGLQPARLLCPWDFPDKSTGAGCHFLLQGIFSIQGFNPIS